MDSESMLILPPQSILMGKFDQHWIIGGLLKEGSLGAFKAGKEMTDLWVSGEQECQTKDQSWNYSRTITLGSGKNGEETHTWEMRKDALTGPQWDVDDEVRGKESSLGWFHFWLEDLAGGWGITCQDLASTKRWGFGGKSESSLGQRISNACGNLGKDVQQVAGYRFGALKGV